MRLVPSLARTLSVGALVVGLAGFGAPPGPNIFVLTIDASKQGRLKGDSPRGILASGLAYQVTTARDAATGQPTGRRQYLPIVITKEWGASSPQLYSALAGNEILKTVQIDRYVTTPAGTETITETVKLTNAVVVGIRYYTDTGKEMEEVSFSFQRIEFTNNAGKTVVSDDWMR